MAVRTVAVRLKGEVDDFVAGFKRAGASVKDLKGEFDKAQKAGTQGTDELAQGALAMGGAILLGFGMAAKAAMQFEKEMSNVGAASGATASEMNALRDAAMQAGKDTAFSAREAAQGQTELAKAGVSVKDILGGGLKGALDLAAAGQIGVAKSAEIAATAMTQFKLKGDAIPHLADLLAAGANKAQGGVDDLGMALNQGGLVASQFGLTIDETVGTLTAFASAGLLGSDAGTSLKTALLMLGNPTEKSASLMKELGINAYDAAGNFVGMANLAGQLRSQLGGLTQEQRNAALAQIFGADAVRAANVLYENGAAGINKWTSEVNDSGAASRTAAEKTNNLAGDLERLQGTFETALIQTGTKGSGVLRTLAQAADGALTGFMQLPGFMQNTATALVLMAGAALAAAGAYGVMAPKVRESQAALIGMGPAGKMANAAMVGVARGVGIALAAIAVFHIANAAMADNSVKTSGDVDRLGESLALFGKTGKSSGLKDLSAQLKHFNYDVKTLQTGTLAKAGTNIAKFTEALAGGDWSAESVKNATKRLTELDTALAAMVKGGHQKEAEAAFARLSQLAEEGGTSVNELRNGLPQYGSALKDAAEATEDAGQSLETGAGQARLLAGSMAAAVQEAGSLEEALSSLNDVNMSAAEASGAFKMSILTMTQQLRENKSAWNENTVAGLENQQLVRDRIKLGQEALSKQYEQTLATKGDTAANAEAAASHGRMRASIIESAVAAGINRQAVTAMVDALFRIPENTAANISVPGAKPSTETVATLDAKIKALKDKQVQIREQGGAGAWRQIKALQEQIDALHSKQVTITSTFIKKTIETREERFNITRRWGGINLHAAAGGLTQATSAPPGTLYQWAEPETGGEAFIPRRGNAARSKSILAEAASWYGGQVSFGGQSRSVSSGSSGSPQVIVNARVFVGDREITDIVRVEVDQGFGQVTQALQRGR